MKAKLTLVAAVMPLLIHAAVPLRWTVETSRVQPVTFESYHGETLELEATLKSYGKPITNDLQGARIYWQTNGLGSAYWSAPASASGNVLRATWTPAMDTGAKIYNCFLGRAGDNYRAALQLLMRSSPGADPNELELPRKHIDFAEVEVKNAPWASATIVHAVFAAADNARMTATNALAKATAAQSSADAAQRSADAATDDIEAAKTSAQEALAYASGVYNYMHADENAWFSGTNYVFGADAASRHKFVFEDGMDLGTVPCSMALIEKRDGVNQTVWDQRDWTSWYWSFKAGQLREEIAATNAVIYGVIGGKADKAWSHHTSASGRDNPDTTTTWVETESVTLAPGMAWETVATVSGCSYWTIVGDGARIGGSGTNSVFDIKDFEGNSVMKITKTASYMTYLECGSEIYTSGRDNQGRVTFTMRTSVKPTAEFTTDLHEDFVGEEDAACPAVFEWENVSSGVWRIHFLAKPGASACFAKFKVEVEGSTTVEYANAPTVNGGLIFNGKKIAPVIPASAKVGDTITWKVVQ